MSRFCQCGQQPGYQHEADCPFPLYHDGAAAVEAWKLARELARYRIEWNTRWTRETRAGQPWTETPEGWAPEAHRCICGGSGYTPGSTPETFDDGVPCPWHSGLVRDPWGAMDAIANPPEPKSPPVGPFQRIIRWPAPDRGNYWLVEYHVARGYVPLKDLGLRARPIGAPHPPDETCPDPWWEPIHTEDGGR